MTDSERIVPDEETLDPPDWEKFRTLAHRMVDDMVTFLQTVRERPAWRPVPGEVARRFDAPLPQEGIGAEAAYEEFREIVLPYPMGNVHPRFWGWVSGTGTPFGMMAEMLAAGMNPNVKGYQHSASLVEAQVISWCKEMFSFPETASGLLVSGGSMANLVGLAVARNACARGEVRRHGLQAYERSLTLYCSSETHSSIQKAIELLGLGDDALRRVPVDEDFRIDLEALGRMLAADRSHGAHPFCLIGNAGTVNTGAVDDLEALADLCAAEHLWFHVDGALGAMAYLSPRLRKRVAGLERADSLAFDMHKWLYMPYEVGCILVRREELHRAAFSLVPSYLATSDRGVASGSAWFADYGPQLSRGFRSLKVWLSIKEHGIEKYARLVEQNVAQASYVAAAMEASPDLELLAPVALNVVAFRFRTPELEEAEVDALNREILHRLHESGEAVPSQTVVEGRVALRIAITNHRSRRSDFDRFVAEVIRVGRQLVATGKHRSARTAQVPGQRR